MVILFSNCYSGIQQKINIKNRFKPIQFVGDNMTVDQQSGQPYEYYKGKKIARKRSTFLFHQLLKTACDKLE